MKLASRRSVLFSIALIPAVAVSREAPKNEKDTILLKLGNQFDELAGQIDDAIENGSNIDWEILEQFSRIEAEIVGTCATTMEGLFVKARARCWALLGDLDYSEQSPITERIELSIVRDLIRLYNPSLENPGALKKLVKEVEESADRSSA
jgi:hypothetical protein